MVTRVIDIHPHIISDDETTYPHSPLGGKQSDWSHERPVTFEDFTAAMDEAGVDKAAIVQSSTCYGFNNSYLMDSVAKDPGRVVGVGTINVSAPDAPQVMEAAYERGIAGLRLFTGGSTMAFNADWIDDPQTFPAWEKAGELGMPICVQCRPPAFDKVDGLAKRFPKVKIVIDHLGRVPVKDGPPYAEAEVIFRLADNGNVYLKTSPRTFDMLEEGDASPETFYPKLISVFGADHIAFGSNYPSSSGTLPEIIKRAHENLASLSEADRHMILAGTAQILYPALAD